MDKDSLELLLGQGRSVAEIAKRFGKDPSTVSYWMGKYGLEAVNREKHAPKGGIERGRLEAMVETGLTIAELATALGNGETDFFLEGRGYYRCKRCRSDAVARRRRKVKTILVEEAGGCCRICGYDGYVGALEFHHLDPPAKRMPLSAEGIAYALDTLRAEAKKCVLLCANCHAEVENGVATLPIQ